MVLRDLDKSLRIAYATAMCTEKKKVDRHMKDEIVENTIPIRELKYDPLEYRTMPEKGYVFQLLISF